MFCSHVSDKVLAGEAGWHSWKHLRSVILGWKSKSLCHVKPCHWHHPSVTDTAKTWAAFFDRIGKQDFCPHWAWIKRHVGLMLLKNLCQWVKNHWPLTGIIGMLLWKLTRVKMEDRLETLLKMPLLCIDYPAQPDSTGRVIWNNCTKHSSTPQIPFGMSGHFTLTCLLHSHHCCSRHLSPLMSPQAEVRAFSVAHTPT